MTPISPRLPYFPFSVCLNQFFSVLLSFVLHPTGSFYLTSGISASVASMALANSPVRLAQSNRRQAQSNGNQSQSNPSHMLYYSPNVSISQIANKPNDVLERAKQLPASPSSSTLSSSSSRGHAVPPFLYLSRRHNHNHNNNNYKPGQMSSDYTSGVGAEKGHGECLAVNVHGDAVYCGYVMQPDKSTPGAMRPLPCRLFISADR